ncbi:hypothetical protein RND71_028629 [Anisodus tanguticus]|uniref:Glutaredoxin domain-containing protein n=1 Tax=Anisodus tanguticus TaxID=243964 RepID=A0AAE1V7A1_9SOLA|nr:hypothetical protein RND71_028629 [Anisodus tanguticus]
MVKLELSRYLFSTSSLDTNVSSNIKLWDKLFQGGKCLNNMDMVMKLGAESPVVIFSKSTCCISHSIETLIRGFGANPLVYELDKLSNGKQMEKALVELLGCKSSVPAVFIGEEFVGGSNEIMSLNVRGKLKNLLLKANAIWI